MSDQPINIKIDKNDTSPIVIGTVGGNVNNHKGNKNYVVQGDDNQAIFGDENTVAQQQEALEGVELLTKAEILELLSKLETLVQETELPAETKVKVIEDLSATKTATSKEEPNKNHALDRLTSVAETLEKTSKSLDAGQKIWQVAKPILIKVATWLGAAAGSYFSIL